MKDISYLWRCKDRLKTCLNPPTHDKRNSKRNIAVTLNPGVSCLIVLLSSPLFCIGYISSTDVTYVP